jgi:hypothetical protein
LGQRCPPVGYRGQRSTCPRFRRYTR